MGKKALLFIGNPNKNEDANNFYRMCRRDSGIMKGLFEGLGYSVEQANESNLFSQLSSFSSTEDFAFYYCGHGNNSKIGSFNADDVLSKISKSSNNKYLFFDSCSEDYFFKNSYNVPSNSKIVFAKEVPYSKSIAKLIWDLNVRGRNLENLTNKDFAEIKQNWVNVLEN